MQWQLLMLAIRGPLASTQVSTYGTYSGALNGSYTGSTTGIYSATTYDSGRAYAAQQMASAQTAANFAAIQVNGQQALDELQNSILKDNTVMPGEWIGGFSDWSQCCRKLFDTRADKRRNPHIRGQSGKGKLILAP